MAQVKVKVLNAIVDGKRTGEELTLDEKQAKYLEGIKYVEIVGKATATKSTATKGKTATKK